MTIRVCTTRENAVFVESEPGVFIKKRLRPPPSSLLIILSVPLELLRTYSIRLCGWMAPSRRTGDDSRVLSRWPPMATTSCAAVEIGTRAPGYRDLRRIRRFRVAEGAVLLA